MVARCLVEWTPQVEGDAVCALAHGEVLVLVPATNASCAPCEPLSICVGAGGVVWPDGRSSSRGAGPDRPRYAKKRSNVVTKVSGFRRWRPHRQTGALSQKHSGRRAAALSYSSRWGGASKSAAWWDLSKPGLGPPPGSPCAWNLPSCSAPNIRCGRWPGPPVDGRRRTYECEG